MIFISLKQTEMVNIRICNSMYVVICILDTLLKEMGPRYFISGTGPVPLYSEKQIFPPIIFCLSFIVIEIYKHRKAEKIV